MGHPPQLSKVYFYNEGFGRLVQMPEVVPPLADILAPLTSVIDQAAAEALEKFADKPLWVEATIMLLAADFLRWIGLVQTAGYVNWNELWNALEDSPDRPASPPELQTQFEKDIKPGLCKIFRFRFEFAGLDWSLVELLVIAPGG
jgi:hypothetical protein